MASYRNMETGARRSGGALTRKASFRSELLSSPILGHQQKMKKASLSPPRPSQRGATTTTTTTTTSILQLPMCRTVTEEDPDYSDRGMDESGPGVGTGTGTTGITIVPTYPTTTITTADETELVKDDDKVEEDPIPPPPPPVVTATQDFKNRIAAERARIQMKREQLNSKSREAEAAVAAEHEVLLKYHTEMEQAEMEQAKSNNNNTIPMTMSVDEAATVTTTRTSTTADSSPTSWMEEIIPNGISRTVSNDSSSTATSSSVESLLVEPIHNHGSAATAATTATTTTTTTTPIDLDKFDDGHYDDIGNNNDHDDYLASTSNETKSRSRSSLIHDEDDDDDEVRIDLLQSEDEQEHSPSSHGAFAGHIHENTTENARDALLLDLENSANTTTTTSIPSSAFTHHEQEDEKENNNDILGILPAEDNLHVTKDLLLSSPATSMKDGCHAGGMEHHVVKGEEDTEETDLEMAVGGGVRTVKIQPLSTTTRKRDQSSSFFRTKSFWAILIIFILAVIAVILMMVFLFRHEGKLEASDASQPVAPLTPLRPCELETNVLTGCQCQDVNPTELPPEVGFNRGVVLPFLLETGVKIGENISASSCSVENQALVFVSDLNNFEQVPPTNLQILQRYVLAVLYQSLGGDQWDRNDLWLDPKTSECEWYGIVCSEPSQRIIQIELYDNSLNGTLPGADIGLIQSIRHLDFDDNSNLEGQLMSEITRLPFLQSISFANTSMSGTLPNVWSDGLLELQLRNTKMTGRIPTELGITTRLRELDLSNNAFTGSIPAALIELNDLEFLDVSSNAFTGTLPSFWPTVYLTNLNVAHNAFNGSLPDPYASSLAFLNFEDTSFTGTVPGAYCNLTSLDSIVVDCQEYDNLSVTCPCCQCPNN